MYLFLFIEEQGTRKQICIVKKKKKKKFVLEADTNLLRV